MGKKIEMLDVALQKQYVAGFLKVIVMNFICMRCTN